MQKFTNRNGVLSSAIIALSKTVTRVENKADSEWEIGDAIMLQECASVIARSTTGELLSAMKGMRVVSQV